MQILTTNATSCQSKLWRSAMAIVALSTTEYMVSSITNCFQDVGTYKTVNALAAWSSGIVYACHRRRLDLHLTAEI
jgi:hypothetical protein